MPATPFYAAAVTQQDHSATSGTSGRWSGFKDHPMIALVTFLIALLGAVTGTASFFMARDIEVYATASYGPAQRAWSLQVSLVNNSQRGVSLVDAELYVGESPVARLERWLGSVPDSSDPRPENEVFDGAQPPPVAITGGSSIVGTAIFAFPDEGDLDLWNQVLSSGVPRLEKPEPIRLRLYFQPDHVVTVPVAPPPAWAAPREFEDPGFAPGWHGLYGYRSGGMVDVITLNGDNDRPGLGRLALFRDAGTRSFYTIERPIPPHGWVDFPLPALRPGTYSYSYTFDGETVAAVTLVQPCPRRNFEDMEFPDSSSGSGVEVCLPPD